MKRLVKVLSVVSGMIGFVGFTFALGVGFLVQDPVINRQSRTLNPSAGYTVPHELKRGVFYVTPKEDQLMGLSRAVVWCSFAFMGVSLFVWERAGRERTGHRL